MRWSHDLNFHSGISKYSELLSSGHLRTERTVLIVEVSLFLGGGGGVEDVLWLVIVDYLVPVVCVHIRGVSAIRGSGLEGCLQFRIWIRGVSAIQGLD